MIRICDTCPFLVGNHGKKHPAGWYRRANIRRLWDGLRTAKAPGMVCHSSDPDSVTYGSIKAIHPDVKKRECAGALILIIKHVNDAGKFKVFRDYQRQHAKPLTLRALRYWVDRYVFMQLPSVDSHRSDEVGVP